MQFEKHTQISHTIANILNLQDGLNIIIHDMKPTGRDNSVFRNTKPIMLLTIPYTGTWGVVNGYVIGAGTFNQENLKF